MASSKLKKLLIANELFRKEVEELYCSTNYELYAERFETLTQLHEAKYGKTDKYVSSPGRIEVCGNHTDHNNGKVLCASISVDTLGAITATDESVVRIDSIGYPSLIVDFSDLAAREDEKGTSEGIVRGVLAYLHNNGYKIGGFNATTTSNVFQGAGVSSSAAFEILVIETINILYNETKMTALFKAMAAQYAENVYFGKPCGLMDQSAIALGGVSYIDFKDEKNPAARSIKWHFENKIAIVLVNTGGNHANLTEYYAEIRTDMNKVSSFFGQKTLRFVDEEELKHNLNKVVESCSGKAVLRAFHFADENKRVVEAVSAIENQDLDLFLSNIQASGDSSYKLLQNCFTPYDRDQRIPLGLALAERQTGIRAARVHGGGFAGTILCFVEPKYLTEFTDYMVEIFGKDSVFNIGIRNTGTREVNIKL